jgi:hypothetical protein
LRLWEFEGQLHIGTVARGTPSNKRLLPSAAGETMGAAAAETQALIWLSLVKSATPVPSSSS